MRLYNHVLVPTRHIIIFITPGSGAAWIFWDLALNALRGPQNFNEVPKRVTFSKSGVPNFGGSPKFYDNGTRRSWGHCDNIRKLWGHCDNIRRLWGHCDSIIRL